MRINRILILPVCLAAACSSDRSRPPLGAELLTAPVFAARGDQFHAHPSSAEEVPNTGSLAQGQAQFRLSADGSELHYKLIVANIENVTQSHIHMAATGVNGPIVAWLYPDAPPLQLIPGRSQGVLAEGVITDARVVGPLAGQGLDALLDAIRSGNAYVNVHTTQFPPGEIRGQMR